MQSHPCVLAQELGKAYRRLAAVLNYAMWGTTDLISFVQVRRELSLLSCTPACLTLHCMALIVIGVAYAALLGWHGGRRN